MWGAIAKAVAPALISRVFGGGRPRPSPAVTTTRQEYDFARLAAEARKAGFNPLTALASGVSTGATQTAFPPLASERYLGESLGETFSTLFGQQSGQRPWSKTLEESIVIDEGGFGIPSQGGGHRGGTRGFASVQPPPSTDYGRSYSYTPVGMGGPSGTVVPHQQAESGSNSSLSDTVALGNYYGGGFTYRDEYLPSGKKPEMRNDTSHIIIRSGKKGGQAYLGLNPELFESSPAEQVGAITMYGAGTVSNMVGEHGDGGGVLGTASEGLAWAGMPFSKAYEFVTGNKSSAGVANMRATRQLRECRDGDMVACSIHNINPEQADDVLASRAAEARRFHANRYFLGMDPDSAARRRQRFKDTFTSTPSQPQGRRGGSGVGNRGLDWTWLPRTISGTGSHLRRRRR